MIEQFNRIKISLLGLVLWAMVATVQAEQATNSTGSGEVFVAKLTGIVIEGKSENVKQAGISGIQGVVVNGPEFLMNPEFKALMERHLNGALTEASAKELQVEIVKYCRSIGHLVVDVFYREQEIVNGTIQIAVVEGRIGKIKIDRKGTNGLSDEVILKEVHLQPGMPVLKSGLDADMDFLNGNVYSCLGTFQGSFRQVQPELTPGDHLGEVDMNLKVAERNPLRVYLGYDNDGTPTIGKSQFFTGLNWANAFGLDHRFNYNYVSDTAFDRYSSHQANYTIPLPWRDEFTISGGYGEMNPDLSQYNNYLKVVGTFYQVGANYKISLPEINDYKQVFNLGFDYKSIDTPLFFNQYLISSFTKRIDYINIADFSFSYQSFLPDSYGNTSFSGRGVYSFGGLVGSDTDADYISFSGQNQKATANYFYGQCDVRRETRLPGGFSWVERLAGQLSDSTLPASELFGAGGFATVRGYDERTAAGDEGAVLQTELRTPQFYLSNITGKSNARDWLQAFAFCDYGCVLQLNPLPSQHSSDELLSVGAGLRTEFADNLRFRLDYGYQLYRDYVVPGNVLSQSTGQLNIGIEFSY